MCWGDEQAHVPAGNEAGRRDSSPTCSEYLRPVEVDHVTVGIVGPDDTDAVERSVEVIESGGRDATIGDAESVLETGVDAILTFGESAFLSVARAGPSVPILPVDAGRGIESVPEMDLESAVAHLFSDRSDVARSLFGVDVAGEPTGRAVLDVTLTTSEPAKISEFGVYSGETAVANFRADGVVVATPVGSQGYARRAGGPAVSPDLTAAVVVPIAPFAIDLDRWVLDLAAPVRVAVEREEVPVTLQVDDRAIGEVRQDDPVEIRLDGSFTLAVVPESQPYFDD